MQAGARVGVALAALVMGAIELQSAEDETGVSVEVAVEVRLAEPERHAEAVSVRLVLIGHDGGLASVTEVAEAVRLGRDLPARTVVLRHRSDQPLLGVIAEGLWAPLVDLREPGARVVSLGRAEHVRRFAVAFEPPARRDGLVVRARHREDGSRRGVFRILCPGAAGGEDVWLLSCQLPAANLDLRFDLGSYQRHFVNTEQVGVAGAAGPVSLPLASGGAVHGWTEPRARVTIGPASETSSSSWQRQPLLLDELEADSEGYYQVRGLPAGAYLVVAEHPRLGVGALTFTAAAGETAAVRGPELKERSKVEVTVHPPRPPVGGRWTLHLIRMAEPAAPSRVHEIEIGDEGWQLVADIAPGPYRARLTDSRGDSWLHELVEVHPVATELVFEVSAVLFRGLVVRGGEVAPNVDLVFGSSEGPRSVSVRSDDSGRIEGFLPRPGTWRVDLVTPGVACSTCPGVVDREVELEPIEVEASAEGIAEVQVEIPDTALTVQVRERRPDGSWHPARGAALVALRVLGDQVRRRGAVGATDDSGQWTLEGVPPGKLEIMAQSADGLRRSEWEEAVLEAASPRRLTIDLDEPRVLRLRLRHAGTPIAAALVVAIPRGGQAGEDFVSQGYTDLAGSVELRLPPAAQACDLLVVAAGFATKLTSVVPADEPLLLELGREGGALVLEPLPPDAFDARRGLVLLREGARLEARFLPQFVSARIRGSDTGFVLEQLEPGEYSVCRQGVGACSQVLVIPGLAAGLGNE
jgi:hypothetical protein